MWHFIGVALWTVSLTGLVGTSVGAAYYVVKVTEREKDI